MSTSIIRIQNVSKSYYRDSFEIPVLNNISLDIAEGAFVALMGPSGSGKTTLLNLIAGIDRPTHGNIIVGGTDIAGLSESGLAKWRSNTIGFIFQFYNLIPVLTAYENVELPLLLTSLSKNQRREHVELALNVVGLGDRIHHYPKQLSGGQEQRVAIARAIATDPAILVADEPTGDLDRVSAEEILNLMERLNTEFKKTIVVVTHDPHAASRAHILHHLEKGDLKIDRTHKFVNATTVKAATQKKVAAASRRKQK
jgi:putative ABC transport system ATP-binding protein